jgi:poly-gamma-glutamate capsule biosynthesis protein CapA/YwtB (metallophosphatase superfamily)
VSSTVETGAMSAALTLDLVGDINLKRDLQLRAEYAFDLVDAQLASADVRLGNLEGAFYDPTVELEYKPGWFHLEPDMAVALQGRFDAVGCANNVHHGAAIASSTAILDRLGICHAGAGCNADAARAPAIFTRGGLRFGLLSFTSVFWPIGHAATATAPGVATIKAFTAYEPSARVVEMPGVAPVIRTWPDATELAQAEHAVRALRPQVDMMIVYCHWGVTGSNDPTDYQRSIGHALIDAGADIVAGAHPHQPQPVERYAGGLILYSLGNFIFGWQKYRNATRDGLLARVSIVDGALGGCVLLPVQRTSEDQASILDPRSGEGARIFESIDGRSRALGTHLHVEERGIIVE